MKACMKIFIFILIFLLIASTITGTIFFINLSPTIKDNMAYSGFALFGDFPLDHTEYDDYFDDLDLPDPPDPFDDLKESEDTKNLEKSDHKGAYENKETKTLNLTNIKEINIHARACKLFVKKTDEVKELTVDFSYYSSRISYTPKFILEKDSENNVNIKILEKYDFLNFLGLVRNVTIDVKIPVPYSNEIDIDADAAKCEINNLTDLISLDFDLNATDLNGDNLNSKGTKIEANASTINITNLSGGLKCDFNADTVKLDMNSITNDMEFEANASTVNLYIPTDSSANVDMSGTASTFSTDFDLSKSHKDARSSLKGTLGSGEHKFSFEGTANTVRLKKRS